MGLLKLLRQILEYQEGIVLTAALKLSLFLGNYFMICKKIISAKKLSIPISLQTTQHCPISCN